MNKIKFMLDYGCDTLWSVSKDLIEEYGYNIKNLKSLGLSEEAINLNNIVKHQYAMYLNPIYEELPSFWSLHMHISFQKIVRVFLETVVIELGKVYEFQIDYSSWLKDEERILQEHKELIKFIKDPIQFYIDHGINYSDNLENEINVVNNEYKKWKIIELSFIDKNRNLTTAST